MSERKTKIVHNFDGEEIDLLKDDLASKLTYESANFIRRLIAYIIDLVIVVVIWYLISNVLFKEIDAFMETLGKIDSDLIDPAKQEEFKNLVWKLFFNLLLAWVGSKALYFTLVPAILGEGRTLGKLAAGIGALHLETLEEVSPSRLILREIIGRCLIETVFISPNIVSCIIAFCRDDGRSLHDLIAKTVVIKLDLYDID